MTCVAFSARTSSVILTFSVGISVGMMVGMQNRVVVLVEGFDVDRVGHGHEMSCRTCAMLVCNLFCMAEGVMLNGIQGKWYGQR